MLITEIFGPNLLPTHEYVGWLNNRSAEDVTPTWRHDYNFLVNTAHTFLSQPMEEGDFVRPPKPNKDDFVMKSKRTIIYALDPEKAGMMDANDYREAIDKHENWKPLFKGEWEILELTTGQFGDGSKKALCLNGKVFMTYKELFSFKTRNDFATHCFKQGIPLELNEEYQIQ